MLLLYIVNVTEASGSVWLDVYRFPQDVWFKELETKQVMLCYIGKLLGKPSILIYLSIRNAHNFLRGTTVIYLFQDKIYCLFVLRVSLLFSGNVC